MEYYVRRKDDKTFEVVKALEGGLVVKATYTLKERRPHPIHKYNCNCAAGHWHRHIMCRHEEMVERFKANGEQIPYMEEMD